MKRNNYLIKTAAIFLLFIFFGCQKENINDDKVLDSEKSSETIKQEYSDFERVSLFQLKNDTLFSRLSKDFRALELFDIYLKETDFSKKIQSLVIVTDTISVIEKENYKSYTLLVRTVNQKSNQTKNLILEEKNGVSDAFILTYTFDELWLLGYSNGNQSQPKGTVYLEPFDSNNLSNKGISTARQRCAWINITVTVPCGCGHYKQSQCGGCEYYPQWPSTSVSSQYICENLQGGNGTVLFSTEETDWIISGGWPTQPGGDDGSQTVMMMEDTSEMAVYAMIIQMNAMLNNTLSQNEIEYLNANPFEAIKLNDLLNENNNTEGLIATKITIEALRLGVLTQTSVNLAASFFNTTLVQFQSTLPTFPGIGLKYAQVVANEMFILKEENPEWSYLRLYWEANKEATQLILDIGGLVPVVGEVCDVANGIIYTIDGDTVNATLSFTAAIPIAGWFSTGGKLMYKTASNIASKQVLKWVVKTNGLIHFGRSTQLRKVLGITNSANHAHHLIPWSLADNPLVQQAAKAGDAFHMNDVINGFEIAKWRNTTHPAYNTAVKKMLDDAFIAAPNMTPNQARETLQDIIDNLDTVIKNNPNIKLQDLF